MDEHSFVCTDVKSIPLMLNKCVFEILTVFIHKSMYFAYLCRFVSCLDFVLSANSQGGFLPSGSGDSTVSKNRSITCIAICMIFFAQNNGLLQKVVKVLVNLVGSPLGYYGWAPC